MSSSAVRDAPLTLWERLQMVKDLLPLPIIITLGQFKQENKHRSYRRAAFDSVLRWVGSLGWSLPQVLAFYGAQNSTQVYDAWVRKKKFENVTDDIEEGAKIHWIGERNYDRVLLYNHGGGFCYPIMPEHLSFLAVFKSELEKAGKPIGVAVLAYSLAPFAAFPVQLRQLNAAAKHILSKGTSPSNLVLAGDSAGGNLTVQFLAHTIHHLPGIPPPPTLSAPLGGVALFSPWVAFGQQYPSYEQYAIDDCITPAFYKFTGDIVTPMLPAGQEQWFEQVRGDEAWWRGLDGMVKRVFCSYGEVECLRSPVEDFVATALKPNVQDLKVVMDKRGAHVDFMWDFCVGEGGRNPTYWEAIAWLIESFKG